MNFNLKLIFFENAFQFCENIVKAPFRFKDQLNKYIMFCLVVLKNVPYYFLLKYILHKVKNTRLNFHFKMIF